MSKISTYEVVPVPKLSDKLIGTSVGGEIEDITYNFTLMELLDLFIPNLPASSLQTVLDGGNTATQDINLFGTITTTNLNVTGDTTFANSYFVGETHIQGGLFDIVDSIGTPGQVLTSTGEGVEWYTLPPIFTPTLQQVLTEGNTADIDIILDANLEALDVSSNTASILNNLTLGGTLTDNNSSVGGSGQVLESTGTGLQWVDLPVYSATSPLLFNSVTKTFSIQPANSTQGGYLTANDWITFNGKQDAGSYITALTGEATATGPGSVPITLNNASVIAKVLTGLNVTGGSISASDSILTAFGKVQNQINGLMGGVQYQGVWDAATNNPMLTSSVGIQGHYYIVNVAGNTDLNGITDWNVGDWAIFSAGAWSKVDNTESVTSVNGQIGAVSLTTDDIPEGATNLYYLDSRARAALSFAPGSGAYNSLTGVITIPTDNNQILNGAGYITLASLSASAPLAYNNLTGGFSVQKADATHDGYLSSTDWSTFNNKQNYLGGTGLVKSTAGTITYITDNSSNWNTAYDRSIVSAAVTGTSTKTLTLTEQDGNTIQASWTDLDTGLTSVGVSMPSAFTVTNSPLTTNGTIGITGAGTTLQYIDGTGALQTFPGLTGFVPYTGATTDVNLGTYGLLADYLQLNILPTSVPTTVGTMSWNDTDGTMDIKLKGGNVTLQVGEENVARVVNKSGIDLLEANYQVVRVRKVAEGGAQGQRLAVVLAQGNSENNSTEVLGLVTETILVNQEGFVTCFGEVKEINTTGSLQGETWVDGDILYLSSTVAGGLTNIRPVAPNHSVIVGYVTYAHSIHGKIYMAIDTGYELGELHNVYAPSPTDNQSIYWNVANSRYQLNTIGGILGYTPANAATLISTTAPLSGGGDLSANRTLSISQSGTSTDGYLSSTDWNTFNNKQPAGNYVPTSRLLSINGTQYDLSADRSWSVGTVTSVSVGTGTTGTDVSANVSTQTTTPLITINVPFASAVNTGKLSNTDWSTFNTKVGGVTASSPLASSGGQTPNITIQQASGSQDGYLSSTDWTTFNNKQASGNYITSLTGEATASGPGAAAVTLNNASVTGKVLTGVNITGGSISATDSILTAFGKVQNQINGLVGGSIYQGTWNAATNTPALASGVGTKGYYYIVSVAGTTNLDGITDWFVGDWAIFDGTAWQQVDNTDAVVSVNGQTGAVSLTTDNIPEGATNKYFTNALARAALSFTAGSGAYNSTTGLITIPTNTNQLTNGASFITLASLSGTAPIVYSNTTGAISITQAGTASNGYLSSADWNTFNNKQSALTNPVTGTGTSGYLSKFTTTGSTIGNSAIYDDGSTIIELNKAHLSSYRSYIWNDVYLYNTLNLTDASYNILGRIIGTGSFAGSTGALSFYTNGNALALTLDGSQNATFNGNIIVDKITPIITLNGSPYGNSGAAVRFLGWSPSSTYLNWQIDTAIISGNYLAFTPSTTAGGSTFTTPVFYITTVGAGVFNSSITASSIIKSGGTSSQYLMADGSVSTLTNPVTGTGTTTYIPKFTSSSAIGNSAIQDDGTNVIITSRNTTTTNYIGSTLGSGGIYFSGDPAPDIAYIGYNYTNVSGTEAVYQASRSSWRQHFGNGSTNQWKVAYRAGAAATGAFTDYITLSSAGDTTFRGGVEINASVSAAVGLKVKNDILVYNTISFTDASYTVSGFIQGTSNELRLYTNNNVLALTLTSAQKAIFPNDATINGVTAGKGAGSLSYSTAFGVNASAVNTTGNYLTSIGRDANRYNTTGQENTAIGAFALVTNTTGSYNTAVGSGALAGVNGGSQNTAVGLNAGTLITTGDKNTIIGAFSGSSISTGTGNTIIGANISGLGTSLSNNVIIGSSAAIRMQFDDQGRFGAGMSPVSTRSYIFKNVSAVPIGFEMVESAGVHSIYFTPNNGSKNTISSNYFSGGVYLPLTLSGRENFTDLVLNTSGNVVIGSATDGGNKFEVRTSTYNRIATYFSGSYTSGFKFSDLYGGIQYDASIDTLELFSNYPSGKLILKTNSSQRQLIYSTGDFDYGGYNVMYSANATYRQAFYGAMSFLWRNAEDAYINSNHTYSSTNTNVASYASANGIGRLGIAGGTLEWGSYNGSVVAGTAYALTTTFTIGKNGLATFWGAINAYAGVNIGNFDGQAMKLQMGTATGNTYLRFYDSTGGGRGYLGMFYAGSSHYLLLDGSNNDLNLNGNANLYLQTAGVTRATINSTATTFVTKIEIAEESKITSATSAVLRLQGGGYGGSYNTTLRSIPGAIGILQLGNNADNYIIGGNTAVGGYLIFRVNATSESISSGIEAMRITSAGALQCSYSVTATAFYESSDSRLKQIISDDYKALGVEYIKARLYIKDGKEEIGYFAQDFESILPSAVSKNDAGFLSLSYTQVHTAKIAIIEDEVTILKNRVSELEYKLQKYEA